MTTYRGPHVAVYQRFDTSSPAISVENLPSTAVGTAYEVYNNESIIAQVQDTNTQKLQAKLISMHANIVSAINTLEKIIPISEKVCNDQDA